MKRLIILSLFITGCSCLDLKKNPPPEQEFCIISPLSEDFLCSEIFSDKLKTVPQTKIVDALLLGEYLAAPRDRAEELFIYFKNLCDKEPSLCDKNIKKKINKTIELLE